MVLSFSMAIKELISIENKNVNNVEAPVEKKIKNHFPKTNVT